MTILTAVRAALPTAAATALLAAPALATDGNLYYGGPQPNWFSGSQATVTVPQTHVWQVELPEVATSLSGQKWAMAWGCPVGGSEIAYVNWSALRYASPSALAQEVVSEYGTEYSLPDVYLPQSPSLASNYGVAMPGGRCSATLHLRQGLQVGQHKRVYWIGHPHVYYRDLTAPSVGIRTVPAGWINASTSAIPVSWGAADNWGSDGMTWQTVSVAGIPKWSGLPGAGEHAATIDLAGVPDGSPQVVVDVAGDGTAAGRSIATISLDRTPPGATPPTATLTGTPGAATFTWTTADVTSGVADSQVEVNEAPDGAVSGRWIAVGQAIPGAGAKTLPNAGLAAVGDGIHATRVRVRDNAGNVAHSAGGEVVVDRTVPSIALGTLPTGYVRNLTLGVQLDDNLAGRLGLGATRIVANSAPDGSETGIWVPLREPEVLAPGAHRLPLAFGGLPDGRHLVRISTENGGPFGSSLVAVTTVTLNVDQTSPVVTDVVFRRVAPERIEIGWIARDPLSGIASARIEWFDGATWKTHTTAPAAAGAGSVAFDTSLLPAGDHPVRLIVSDGAGNETMSQSSTNVNVDRAAPSITGLLVSGGPPWTVAWHALDTTGAQCATKVLVNGPQTGLQWVEIATAPGGNGPRSIVLPLEGFAPGAYRVRVTACDAVGNTATVETAGVLISARSAAAGAGSPYGSRLADARLTVSVAGIRAKQVGDGRRFTVRVGYGARVRITGRLTDSAGRPIAGAEVGARHPAIGVVATGRTRADGRYAITVVAERSGVLRMGVADNQAFLPEFPSADVRLLVMPRVTFRASRRTAVALGAPIVFTGRVSPSPRARGITNKTVVLEWRDPIRKVWRPVINARVRPSGAFRIAWRFQARGQRIPMRVRVPFELGWNLEEQASTAVTIAVR